MMLLNFLLNTSVQLSDEDISRIALHEGLSLTAEQYTVVVLRYTKAITDEAKYDKYYHGLPCHLIQLLEKQKLDVLVDDHLDNGCTVILMNMTAQMRLEKKLGHVYEKLRFLGFDHICMAVGAPVSSPKELRDSYLDACNVIEYRRFDDPENVLWSQNAILEYDSSTKPEYNEYDLIIHQFRIGNINELERLVKESAERVRARSPVRPGAPYPTSIRRMFIELTVTILHIASDAGVDVDALLNHLDPYAIIMKFMSTPQILSWFLTTVKLLRDAMDDTIHRNLSIVITNAIRYIDTHLMDRDLSLDTVSASVGISSGYLSTLFRHENDTGFSEYVKQARMREVCRMLEKTKFSLSQIAEKVGYGSDTYLLRVFKQQFGMTPGEYRKIN